MTEGKATLQKAALGRTRTGVTAREWHTQMLVMCPSKQESSHLCDPLHPPVHLQGLGHRKYSLWFSLHYCWQKIFPCRKLCNNPWAHTGGLLDTKAEGSYRRTSRLSHMWALEPPTAISVCRRQPSALGCQPFLTSQGTVSLARLESKS